MVDSRYNESVISQLEKRWLDDDRYEEEDSCCMCGDEATMDVCGELYCEHCAKGEFRDYGDDAFCSVCEYEITDKIYKVGNEYFCEECFEAVFRR